MTAFGVKWRLYRRGEPQRRWRDAAVLFVAYAATLCVGVLWSRSVDNSTVFWAANGLLAGGLLLLRPRVGLIFALACISLNLGSTSSAACRPI